MGFIIIPLFLIGLFGWYYVVELTFFFWRERKFLIDNFQYSNDSMASPHEKHIEKKTKQIQQKNKKSLFKTYLHLLKHYQNKETIEIEEHIERKLGFILHNNKQKLRSIKVFAATAPLLGLLGTVNGMVVTFKLISDYGNSSSILLSDGISEALLSTQSGLVVAFPLLFFQVILSDRNKKLENHMHSALIEIKK